MHAEIARPPAGDAVLVPLQVGTDDEPGRPHTHRARRSTRRRRCGSRSCRARTTRTASSARTRTCGAAGPRPRRPSSATTSTRARAPGRAVRDHCPQAELFSLADYRTRHAQYKTDPELQAAHAAFPWLMTWDDHEFKDNYADLDLDVDPEIRWRRSRSAAPPRTSPTGSTRRCSRARKPVGKDMPLYRRAQWGSLATFHVLDTRQYRSDQIWRVHAGPARPGVRLLPGRARPGRAGSSAPSSATGCSKGSPAAADAGTCSPTRSASRRIDTATRDSTRRGFSPRQLGRLRRRPSARARLPRRQRLANTVVITGDKHQNSVRNVPPDYRNFDGRRSRPSSSARRSAARATTPYDTTLRRRSATTRTCSSTTSIAAMCA